MRLSKAIDGFWLARRRELSRHTQRDYDLTFRRAVEFWEDPDVSSIRADHVQRFLNHLVDELGLSAKTVANAWTALSALWTWAEVALEIDHPIRGRVKRPAWRRPPIEPFCKEEIKAMLEACIHQAPYDRRWKRNIKATRTTGLRDRAIMLTLLDCGLRASELAGLRIDDYDERRGRLTIRHGKGNKQRMLYLGDTARLAIWKYMATRDEPPGSAPLFATRSGKHMDRVNLLHTIQRCAARAGVANAYPHRFRHTFAINFLRNGGNPLELQRVLGHEKLDTVRIYVSLAEVDIERAQRNASPADNWQL